MTDSPTTEAQATTDQDEPKGLRKQLGEAHAKIKALEADKMSAAFTEIGLDPTKGLGKAISKEYDGEVSTEAVAAYAKEEYGHEAAPVIPPNPVAEVIQDQQAALDQVGETAGSVIQPTEADMLAKAEAEGDYQTTMAIKSNQVAQMAQRQQGR